MMMKWWIKMHRSYLHCGFWFFWENATSGIHLHGFSRRGWELAPLSWVPTDAGPAALQRMHNQNTGAHPPKCQYSAGVVEGNTLYY